MARPRTLGSLSAGELNADLIASTDLDNNRYVNVEITGTFSGTLTFQGSNDGSTWNSVQLLSSGSLVSTTTATGIFEGQVSFKYFRVRMTSYSSGTATGIATLTESQGDSPEASSGAATVTGNVASGATDSGNPVKVAGVYNTTPPTLTNGQRGDVQEDTRANLKVTLVGRDTDSEVATQVTTGDDVSANQRALETSARLRAFDGAAWDRIRTPTTVKTATANASGDTAVWTPASGKKFRLMRALILVPANASHATGAVVDIALRDATSALGVTVSVFCPAVAGTAFGEGFSSGWIDLGNGLLSATADNVLNVNLSAALATSAARVIVAGTEES